MSSTLSALLRLNASIITACAPLRRRFVVISSRREIVTSCVSPLPPYWRCPCKSTARVTYQSETESRGEVGSLDRESAAKTFDPNESRNTKPQRKMSAAYERWSRSRMTLTCKKDDRETMLFALNWIFLGFVFFETRRKFVH